MSPVPAEQFVGLTSRFTSGADALFGDMRRVVCPLPDRHLARETIAAEKDKTLSAKESREWVLGAVRRRPRKSVG
jgi:hypothetical protein